MEQTRSGFVTIIGKPNTGKSTLFNRLIGEKLSPVTYKTQTTRKNIIGILTKTFKNDSKTNSCDILSQINSTENNDIDKSTLHTQIIFTDTAGIMNPKYKLQECIVNKAYQSLEGTDVIIYLISVFDREVDHEIIKKLIKEKVPIIIVISKIDLVEKDKYQESVDYWMKEIPDVKEILPISTKENINIDKLYLQIYKNIPVHKFYYPNDIISDNPQYFLASEIIREKIFLNYKQEIPYSTEVNIEEFEEIDDLINIKAIIYVERNTQKGIIIGKGGSSLSNLGKNARIELKKYFEKKIYLHLYVKILPNWRKKNQHLKNLGYIGQN